MGCGLPLTIWWQKRPHASSAETSRGSERALSRKVGCRAWEQLFVLVTASSQEEALLIGRRVVEKKLAACVTVVPQVMSIFEWEGKVCEEHEWLLVMKSDADVYDALEAEVKTLHGYEVPEILALSVVKGSSELSGVGQGHDPGARLACLPFSLNSPDDGEASRLSKGIHRSTPY